MDWSLVYIKPDVFPSPDDTPHFVRVQHPPTAVWHVSELMEEPLAKPHRDTRTI